MKYTHTDTDLPIENEYPKLIRDKIPNMIARGGEVADIRTLNDSEYEFYLRKKILEEARELFEADSDEHVLEEAADVAEIVEALIEFKGYSQKDINKVRQEKLESRGGFKKRILMLIAPNRK